MVIITINIYWELICISYSFIHLSFVTHDFRISESITYNFEIQKALRTENLFIIYLVAKPNQTWTHLVESLTWTAVKPFTIFIYSSMNIHTCDCKIITVFHYRMPPQKSQGCCKMHRVWPGFQIREWGPDFTTPLWPNHSHCSHFTGGGLRFTEAGSHSGRS